MKSVASPLAALVVLAGSLVCAEDKPAAKGWLGVQIRLEEMKGQVVIEMVLPDSPADKAGLKGQDLILKLEKEDVTDLQTFVTKIGEKKPGDEVTIRIKRDGEEKDVKVKLGETPKQPG